MWGFSYFRNNCYFRTFIPVLVRNLKKPLSGTVKEEGGLKAIDSCLPIGLFLRFTGGEAIFHLFSGFSGGRPRAA